MGGKRGAGDSGSTVTVVLDRGVAEDLYFALALALGTGGGKKKKGKKGKGKGKGGGKTKSPARGGRR